MNYTENRPVIEGSWEMQSEFFRAMEVTTPGKWDTEGPTYRRLCRKLESWAESIGYSEPSEKPWNGTQPRVLRRNKSGRFLFMGDAVEGEKKGRELTAAQDRATSAIAAFTHQVRTERIDGGLLAIATDDETAAEKWARTLTKIAKKCGLVGRERATPTFKVKRLAPKTWVIYW